MSGATLAASLDSRDARRALGALERAGRDPGMLLRPIGVVLIRGTRDRMQREVDTEGNPWAPLQPWYAPMKRSSRMLMESGRLRGSITTAFDANTLAIGTTLPYSAVHQFGATIRPVHSPLLIFRTANGAAWGAAADPLHLRPHRRHRLRRDGAARRPGSSTCSARPGVGRLMDAPLGWRRRGPRTST